MTDQVTYTPRFPTLTALGFLTLWIAILSFPMWEGKYMAGLHSDQYSTGWAIRHWGSEQWRATGHVPLWDPERLGGVVVVAGFGDLFYPSAWMRLVMPTTIAIDLAFVVHYILAGLFLFLLLRMLSISWLGSLIGATAYQLTGVIVSYASPGHDGKLFVSALFPLMLIALVLGIRRRRLEGHALLALTVGLCLLSPQYQTTQYALLSAGIFALYLAFADPEDLTIKQGFVGIGLAAAGVLLGFGLSMIQVLPFLHYIPYSPRSGTNGFDWATSFATPWIHVPEFFLSGFTGQSFNGDYWGPNGLTKLHSEYLGLPVIALAILGFRSDRRRLMKWIVGIGVLFMLVALGDSTPFYRLWWTVVPYVNKTRAPGIAFYQVAFAVAVLAALGAERLERGEGKTWSLSGMIAGGVVALLALLGTFGVIATSYAKNHPEYPWSATSAAAAQTPILIGAVGSALALVVVAGFVWINLRRALPARVFAMGLVFLVGADLYRAGAGFWHWSTPQTEQFATDDIIKHLQAEPLPYRVFDPLRVYPTDALMAFDIPQVTGYHGNHLETYLDLVGGEGGTNLLHSPNLWKLLDVKYVIFPDTIPLRAYTRILGPIPTSLGQKAYLYRADSALAYARVVSAGVKADTTQIVPTLMDPRLDYDKLVLFSPDQPVNPLPVTSMPPAPAAKATVTKWAPGAMSIAINPPTDSARYLVVSENWYKDWKATVNGAPAQVLRGDESLITVPLPPGARTVELAFQPDDYARGKTITMISLVLIFLSGAVPMVMRRVARG